MSLPFPRPAQVLAKAGRYNVVNALTGKCLEMNNATSENGAKAQQWTCGGQAAATWYRF
ncbi:RICIN domain-containing protein [Actinoplanes xinjiangensis]|uniref:RICIN domain-containing protein n=1 Tax=Actinoplanes xinjiangensis TaxID=512350 RepID=UPI00343D3035